MLNRFRKATDTFLELFVYYIVLISFCAVAFSHTEDTSLLTGYYWATITATTIGYGDVTPHSTGGKILSILLANTSVFILGPLIIARILDHLADKKDHFAHEEQEQIKQQLQRIETMLTTSTRGKE